MSTLNGYEIVWHDGGMSGVSTKLVLVPSENLVVVALCNRFQPSVTDEVVASIITEALPPRPIVNNPPTPLQNNASLIGEWTGIIETYEGNVPLTLWVTETGAYTRLGKDEKHPVFIYAAANGYFWAVIKGNLTTEDTARYPHDLSLDLKLRGDKLDGFTLAMCIKNPDNRMGYALSHWTELRRIG